MKLIVSHLQALRHYVTREFYYVTTELLTTYGWKHIEILDLWDGPGTLKNKLINRFGKLPTTILFWEAYEFVRAHTREIARLDCHKCFFADDLHWRNEEFRRMKTMSFTLCETVLATYGYTWAKFYPQLAVSKRAKWIPHAASPDFMVPANPCPNNSIFLSGAITRHYPLRQKVQTLYSEGRYPIIHLRHPGYHCGYNYETNENVGRGYAIKINRHRAGFTDSLTFKYVVAKHFEIPATGALLLAEDAVAGPLQQLGFVEGEHYLAVSADNIEDKIRYILDERNQDEVDRIRKRGQALVWERHKTSDRARQINEACRA